MRIESPQGASGQTRMSAPPEKHGAGTEAARGGAARWWAIQSKYAPYMFVAPFVILFCIFLLYPLVLSIFLSFYKFATGGENRFVGLGHYRFILADRLFWNSVGNTLLFTIAVVCLQIPASLGLAILLNNPAVRFRNVFRFAFFSSHLVGHVFVAVIFRQILTPRHGLMPKFLGMFNLEWTEISWLGDPVWARVSIVLAIFWINIGWGMIYFLA